jgi:hypothetical protein
MLNTPGSLGMSWNVLERLGRSWNVLERLGTSWNVLECLGMSWNVLECLGVVYHVYPFHSFLWPHLGQSKKKPAGTATFPLILHPNTTSSGLHLARNHAKKHAGWVPIVSQIGL